MSKKMKLTSNKNARYEQRKQTEKLIEASAGMAKLQRSAPKFLDGSARYFYEQLAKNLVDYRLVKNLDRSLLTSMAINYQLLKSAYEDINENGQVFYTDEGLARKNPNVDTIDKATKNIKALANELGMSPTSRAKIINDAKTDHDEDDKQESLKALQETFGVVE